MQRSWIVGAAIAALLVATPVSAQVFTLGENSFFDLGGNTLDLGCHDLALAGTFNFAANTASVSGVRHLSFTSSGTLDLDGGSISLAGDWDNSPPGTFLPSGGTVQIVDGCGLVLSRILGANTFFSLLVVTVPGKILEFESGVTQTITSNLFLTGTPGDELALRGTNGGSQPVIDAQGSVFVDYALVYNFDSTPNPITLGPNSEVRNPGDTSGVELCSDITGDLAFDSLDVDQARNHLTSRTVTGDITLCNVIGPYDGTQTGLDCGVDDVSLLRRKLAGESVILANGCQP